MPHRDRFFGYLAFLSGFCALGYQVLYLRHLTTFLGDSLHVHAALLSTFLLGIAAGARIAHLTHRWLAPVELGAGVYAILLPTLTLTLTHHGIFSSVAATPTLTVLTTSMLVAPAALLIGVGLPLFSGYTKAVRSGASRAFEVTYTRYNLGAFLGIVLVEGSLIGVLGIRHSLYLLGFFNILIAVSLYLAGSTRIRRPRVAQHQFGDRLLMAVFVASMASAVVQMLLFRSLNLVLGAHRSNFAAGLAVILLGLSAGAWVASRTRITFHTAMAWLPIVVLPAFMILISPVGVLQDGAWVLSDGMGFSGFIERFVYAALLGLLPMMLIGITLPALMRQERAVAREAGELLWYSGLANASGYLLFVTVLHPHLPGWGLLASTAALALLAAWLGYLPVARKPRWPALAPGLLAGIVACLVLLVAREWDDVDYHLATSRSRIGADDAVMIHRWGGESASLVYGSGHTWLSYNGHPSITIESGGVTSAAELVSGVIPALTAPSKQRAMVLGLGSGITAGAAARVFDQVEVAEINGAFPMLVSSIAHANLDIHSNPRVNLHLTDGRTLLSANHGHFDAIINSVPSPTYYSAGKIYTEEFYRMVSGALREGGVFSTWVSTWDMTEAGVLTVLSTLRRVFPHCELRVLRGGYLFVTCSDRPLQATELARLSPDPLLVRRLRQSLAPFSPGEYLADILLTKDIFEGDFPEGPINTDDRPILESMVVAPRDRSDRGTDPVAANPERFAIRMSDLNSMPLERLVRRAAVYRHVHPEFYRKFFLPVLAANPDLQQARQD